MRRSKIRRQVGLFTSHCLNKQLDTIRIVKDPTWKDGIEDDEDSQHMLAERVVLESTKPPVGPLDG